MTTQKAIERSTSNTIPSQQPAQPMLTRPVRSRWYYSPHADIFETADEFTIVLDMPGVSPENLEVTCENRALIVHGHVEPGNETRRSVRTEYGIGDYFRRFELGDTIDVDRISVHPSPPTPPRRAESGVFTIRLPKLETARPIKIRVSEQ